MTNRALASGMLYAGVLLCLGFSCLCGCEPVKNAVSMTAQTTAAATAAPPAVSPAPTHTPAPTQEPTPSPGPLAGRIVGVDPGHQLVLNSHTEPVAPNSKKRKTKVARGARGVSTHTFEYQINLDVGLRLRDLLEEAGAAVVMTRTENDVDVSNMERALIFNDANVDLAIRLHCNKSAKRYLRGAFMIIAKAERTEFYEENLRAAVCVLQAYEEATGIPARTGRGGVSQLKNQTGLNWCKRPIITIEMGHLSNAEEDKLISSPEMQARMAEGIYRGILNYFCGAEPDVEPYRPQ